MQKTVTIQKAEYQRLHELAERFESLRKLFVQDFFAEPPVKDTKEIIAAFKKTRKYKPAFLKSLERGLQESRYFS